MLSSQEEQQRVVFSEKRKFQTKKLHMLITLPLGKRNAARCFSAPSGRAAKSTEERASASAQAELARQSEESSAKIGAAESAVREARPTASPGQ